MTIVFLLATTFFSGCYATHMVTDQTYDYDKDIAFVFQNIREAYSIAGGSFYYNSKKGFKFVIIQASFKNFSGEKKKIDFRNIYLLDPKSHLKYSVELVALGSVINIFSGFDSTIGTGKHDTEDRRLIFNFPQDEKAEMFAVNNKIYYIHYSDAKQ